MAALIVVIATILTIFICSSMLLKTIRLRYLSFLHQVHPRPNTH